jgi:bifunctional DNA-binding transcriptional regulator/antitoxin component of YhaV-PrlF toxin-antitoxin module
LTDELLLGVTILSTAGRTTVPRQVREVLRLKPTPHKREKVLWTQVGSEVVVTKGTPQSSYKKTILNSSGKAAVPKHIRELLGLKSTPHNEERMTWIRKGDEVIVRRGAPGLIPTD